jgi:hypothetical protein
MSFQEERSEESKYYHCAHEGCEAKCDNHYWGKVKAGDEGWFFQKDGTSWCPQHVPNWVETWRRNKELRLKRAQA